MTGMNCQVYFMQSRYVDSESTPAVPVIGTAPVSAWWVSPTGEKNVPGKLLDVIS